MWLLDTRRGNAILTALVAIVAIMLFGTGYRITGMCVGYFGVIFVAYILPLLVAVYKSREDWPNQNWLRRLRNIYTFED